MRARPLLFPFAIVVTIVVALLPAGWRLGWSRDLAEILRFPLRPFTHAGWAAAAWLRPPRGPVDRLPAADRALVEQLTVDRDVARHLYHREHQRVLELEEQIRQLTMLPESVDRLSSRGIIAHVTSRNPESPAGLVELRIERGAARAVRSGTAAVYQGVHLLGAVVGESRRNACTLQPITSRAWRFVRVRVFPEDVPNLPVERAVLVQLEPTGVGAFTGEVRRTDIVEVGDLVRLDDPAWPEAAQMMIVGRVTAVDASESEPLRSRIVVEPQVHVGQVSYATLLVEETVAGASEGKGNDAP